LNPNNKNVSETVKNANSNEYLIKIWDFYDKAPFLVAFVVVMAASGWFLYLFFGYLKRRAECKLKENENILRYKVAMAKIKASDRADARKALLISNKNK
jgi:hypothetical protein